MVEQGFNAIVNMWFRIHAQMAYFSGQLKLKLSANVNTP